MASVIKPTPLELSVLRDVAAGYEQCAAKHNSGPRCFRENGHYGEHQAIGPDAQIGSRKVCIRIAWPRGAGRAALEKGGG